MQDALAQNTKNAGKQAFTDAARANTAPTV
jgi:hypothetical protein